MDLNDIMSSDPDDNLTDDQRNKKLAKVIKDLLEDMDECVTIALQETNTVATPYSIFIAGMLFSLDNSINVAKDFSEMELEDE